MITFQGERLSTDCRDIIPLAGFLTKAFLLVLEVYSIKIKGPIFGNAHLEELARFTKTS